MTELDWSAYNQLLGWRRRGLITEAQARELGAIEDARCALNFQAERNTMEKYEPKLVRRR